jgi:hypothetical protein
LMKAQRGGQPADARAGDEDLHQIATAWSRRTSSARSVQEVSMNPAAARS